MFTCLFILSHNRIRIIMQVMNVYIKYFNRETMDDNLYLCQSKVKTTKFKIVPLFHHSVVKKICSEIILQVKYNFREY